MNIPESLPQIAAFVLMLVPGLTWSVVKTWLVGIRDPDYGTAARVLDALFISAVFLVIYGAGAVVIFVSNYSLEVARGVLEIAYREWSSTNIAVGLLVLLVVLPGVLSYFANRRLVSYEVTVPGKFCNSGKMVTKTKKKHTNRPQPFPTAWDRAAYEGISPRWVRVRLASNVWVGGYFGPDSYASTYPHEKDLFIEQQWNLRKNGTFEAPVEDSGGVWVSIKDAVVVEWLEVI